MLCKPLRYSQVLCFLVQMDPPCLGLIPFRATFQAAVGDGLRAGSSCLQELFGGRDCPQDSIRVRREIAIAQPARLALASFK